MEKPNKKFTSFFENNAPKENDAAKLLVAQLKQEIKRELDIMNKKIKSLEETIRQMKAKY